MKSRARFKPQGEAFIVTRPAWLVALLFLSYACLCLDPFPAPAQAERPAQRFYFSTDAGVAWQQDLTVKEKIFGLTTREKVHFETGARFDVGVGYQFTDSFAAEFETGLIYNAVSSSGETSINSGNVLLLQIPLFVNALYTVPTGGRLKPFVGAGVGGMFTSAESIDLVGYISGDSDAVFAYQATAGIRYEITKTMDLGLAYKYTGTLEHTFDSFSATLSGNKIHSVLFSFRVRF